MNALGGPVGVGLRLLLAGSLLAASAACHVGEPETEGRQQVDAAWETATATASVSVSVAQRVGAFNNPAWYQNQADHSRPLSDWQVARMRELQPRVTRAWVTPQRYFRAADGVFDFDYGAPGGGSLYRYLDQVASYSDRLFLNFNQCDQSLMGVPGSSACANALYQGIKHYKQRYPKLEFIELFNEPDRDWPEPEGTPRTLGPKAYYAWFKAAYRAVNQVNQELSPTVRLKVGGPVTYYFNADYLQAFLDEFRNDPDPEKRLDFLSYHQYKARSNPAGVASEKEKIREWLAARSLNRNTPVFVTEYGVFPGDNGGNTFVDDLLVHSAAMSVLGMNYAASGLDMPMHWVVSHPTNARKSMFVDGEVYPYYGVVWMQRLLKRETVVSRSDALSLDGLGVNVLATADETGVAVLLTNYQWTDLNGPEHMAAVNLEGISGKLRVTVRTVDGKQRPVSHDQGGGLPEVTQSLDIIANGAARIVVKLERNATALLTVEPRR